MQLNRSAYAQHLGAAGLYLFAVSGGVSQGGVYIGLGLMLVGLLLMADHAWNALRREPAFPIAVILTLYIAARCLAAVSTWPTEPPERFLRDTWDLVAVGGLFSLLVGWWLAGNNGRIALVLQLAVLGLFLGVLEGIDWQHFATYMVQRPLFGMGNGAGLYALVAMAGLLILRSSRLFDGGWQQRRLSSAVIKILLMALFAVFSAVFVLSQTRAAWFAALIVMPAVFVLVLRNRAGEMLKKRVLRFEVIVLAVLMLSVIFGAGIIEKRLGVERSSVVLLFSGKLSGLPADSVGLRVGLWENALERIAERPLLGWGSGSAPVLIRESDVPGGLKHYHNLYLQLAAELGLVGVGLFALWSALAVKAAVHAWRERYTDFDYLLFLAATLAIFLIVSSFQIRHDDERGQYLLILLGALALTHRLRRRQPTEPRAQSCRSV